jgi:Uma2 family endonuclease
MSAALHKAMTLDEFLAWEERQELRYEFDGFAPMAMTGGSLEHSAIERNLITALTIRLRGKRCQPYTSNLKVQVAGSIRYPDALVVCSPQVPRTTMASDPVVVFEILSPSTWNTDLGAKNQEYRDTPSIQRYVILHQDRQQATVFERVAEDWVGHIFIDDAVLAMPEIDIEVPLTELYDGVTFEPAEED